MPLAIAFLLVFAIGCMVGQLVERDRTDLPRAYTRRERRRLGRQKADLRAALRGRP